MKDCRDHVTNDSRFNNDTCKEKEGSSVFVLCLVSSFVSGPYEN